MYEKYDSDPRGREKHFGKKRLTFSYLLQKGNKFAHKVAKDPSWERVEGGSEGDAAHQEDDISGSQICCKERKHHFHRSKNICMVCKCL